MYIGIDSLLIGLSLCCIIFSNFGCQTRTTDILPLKRAAVRHVFTPRTTATAIRVLKIAQMSGQFSWSLRLADCHGCHEKSHVGGLCKICAVWTIVQFRIAFTIGYLAHFYGHPDQIK